jgi:lysophospholipase L1-like esterase
MKRRIVSLLVSALYITAIQIHAQTVYYEADQFQLIGKTSEETETRYERLPAYLKEKCRPPVWNLGKNTSGLAIRFRTNSRAISAKWEVAGDKKIKHEGDKNVYYLANDDLIGSDGEATVDGIHFTGLGFSRFAEKLYDTIRQINNQ